MGPKKNRKRQEDDEFEKQQKQVAELLKKVEKEPIQQEEVHKQKKSFEYDFSNEKLIYLQEEKEKPQKPVVKLTPQQQADLDKKLAKQALEKERKERKKQQKKEIRQKEIQELKQAESKKRLEIEKENQEVERQLKKPKGSGKSIPLFFLFFILLFGALQYQKQLYVRLSKFNLQGEENFYVTLEADSGSTDRELKEKYKKMLLKYHPDKNPNCQDCKEKFSKITAAWEVLGNPEKRKHYDANSGYVTQIKSSSITLTPQNYQRLTEGSESLWIVQVYDSTEKYCHYFSQFWEDIVGQYGNLIKFGRVDIWTQSDMLSYLPYRFQVFPSIYYIHRGEVELCEFDFQHPDSSLKRCIELQYRQNLVTSVASAAEIPESQDNKLDIIFNSKYHIGPRMKILNKKYSQYFKYYLSNEALPTESISEAKALKNKKTINALELNQRDSDFYFKYQQFLQSLIVQKTDTCGLVQSCEDYPCYVLLQENRDITELPQQDSLKAKPVYKITEKEFDRSLQNFKNRTDLMEQFQLGIYQNGHMDLGYLNEIKVLSVEEGFSFEELKCTPKDYSLFGKIKSVILQVYDSITVQKS